LSPLKTQSAGDWIITDVLVHRRLDLASAAEAQLKSALETRSRLLGDDHPATLSTTHQLGVLCTQQGKHADAESLFRASFEGRKTALGEGDPAMLDSMSWLGKSIGGQGRFAEAEPIKLASLEARRQQLGDNHSLTNRTPYNLLVQRARENAAAKAFRIGGWIEASDLPPVEQAPRAEE
jgi:hypothetical protein